MEENFKMAAYGNTCEYDQIYLYSNEIDTSVYEVLVEEVFFKENKYLGTPFKRAKKYISFNYFKKRYCLIILSSYFFLSIGGCVSK